MENTLLPYKSDYWYLCQYCFPKQERVTEKKQETAQDSFYVPGVKKKSTRKLSMSFHWPILISPCANSQHRSQKSPSLESKVREVWDWSVLI